MVTKFVGKGENDEDLASMMNRAKKVADKMGDPDVVIVILNPETGEARIFMDQAMTVRGFAATLEVLAVAGRDYCHSCGCDDCAKAQNNLDAVKAIFKAETVN